MLFRYSIVLLLFNVFKKTKNSFDLAAVAGDGNCQFAAFALQLNKERPDEPPLDHTTARQQVVGWMRTVSILFLPFTPLFFSHQKKKNRGNTGMQVRERILSEMDSAITGMIPILRHILAGVITVTVLQTTGSGFGFLFGAIKRRKKLIKCYREVM